MTYFCCLRSNDGEGIEMEFQGLSDSCEVIRSADTGEEE
ncbi:hypothetical protein AVEN_112065-1, partial [Araneus ventricosus]